MAPNTRLSIHEAARLPGPLKSPRPVLYTHTLCPYAQRVFLTLLLKVTQPLASPAWQQPLGMPLSVPLPHCALTAAGVLVAHRVDPAAIQAASNPPSHCVCTILPPAWLPHRSRLSLRWCMWTCQTSPGGSAASTHAAWSLLSQSTVRRCWSPWTYAGATPPPPQKNATRSMAVAQQASLTFTCCRVWLLI